MRTMLKISVPTTSGNRAITEGSLPRVIQQAMETLKPEAAYFYAERGRRTSIMIFDLKDPTQIPAVSEPFFMGLDAEIELTPVMNAQDLQAGLAHIMRK